ncbi:tyrosine-type recombinase/integrase [Blastochloris sulfoviridis]|uniref:Tyrosine-type recombinase/integrase n=1 Tax=Blastochloris sulfoviridis TaxID=50712 RepID=A0A5M6HTP1_9HYPH|nr:tyrosine-type recombinase/integrase [Blastochloris sulfoviridis]KAA5599236.1 tyrosine-type recombinase/integrase [Blastochloris sulfoviridis]
MRVRLKGINTVRKKLADGTVKVHRYHRATGHPLTGEPGSPEFLACIAAAEKLMRDRLAGVFNGLVRDFTLSPEFGKLADSTQGEYRRMLTKAEGKFGDLPIAALEDPRVRRDFLDWRAQIAKSSGEREADNRLSAISAMLTWARENGRLSANHLAGFKRLYASNRVDRIWLPEHVAAFMKVAPIELQRALILALHTGQRQGDIRRLAWTNYDGTAITLRQGKSKRGGKVAPALTVPCTKALRRMLDEAPRQAAVILTTKTGRPWEKRYFARCWEEASAAAGITDLHFHDLRGTAVTMLAEAGCTVPQIASITGHSLKTVTRILETYLARTRGLAEEAIANFENAKRTKFANRLQTRRVRKPKEGS